ncbi:hypothetical protein M378DRAFT_155326 [Amanita muscaria Koide BX008]|uniref:Microsomal glutathione S-transferase 3 n=1 Tax=Amanita muscaria (strain Koide BX008) TaxID=946122 RepID=A0A0C2XQ14_AMAMK|nr:hypothetical protein M378DRAFT_155326 [Amanita muscaria Koide BX008]
MVTVTVPDGFQYVGAALVTTVWLLFYQVRKVGKFRRTSGVKYPQLYAEKAEVAASTEALKFNCAQRAHQGTLEFLPIIYPTALIAGLKFPHLAAASVAMWTIGRASFTRGYTTGDPDKRVTTLYKLSYIGLFGLLFTSTYVAGEWVVAGICSASKL